MEPTALIDPSLGAGFAGSSAVTPLMARGTANNPLFGGTGPVDIADLQAGDVFLTLVPDGESSFSIGAQINGVLDQGSASLAAGEALYLVAAPEASTWAMLLLGFGGLGVAGYRRSRKSAALD
jgi:hypothetical protein